MNQSMRIVRQSRLEQHVSFMQLRRTINKQYKTCLLEHSRFSPLAEKQLPVVVRSGNFNVTRQTQNINGHVLQDSRITQGG